MRKRWLGAFVGLMTSIAVAGAAYADQVLDYTRSGDLITAAGSRSLTTYPNIFGKQQTLKVVLNASTLRSLGIGKISKVNYVNNLRLARKFGYIVQKAKGGKLVLLITANRLNRNQKFSLKLANGKILRLRMNVGQVQVSQNT